MALTAQDALVYLMVVTAAADSALTDEELGRVRGLVDRLPVFEDFDRGTLNTVANDCMALMHQTGDLDRLLEQVLPAIPERLHDTAYYVAVEIAAVDLDLPQEELRWLEMLRDHLSCDRLVTAAIERAARARLKKA